MAVLDCPSFQQITQRRTLSTVGMVVLITGLYIAVGLVGYTQLEEHGDGERWTVIDALYFTMMTCTTVGYGDLSPGSTGSRVFTLFMIFSGVVVVFSRLAGLLGVLTSPLTARGRAFLERMYPQEKVDLDGNGEVDFTIPRKAYIYYTKNLLPSLVVYTVLNLISAAVFSAIEPGWSYFDAWYHCLVTATTVGYGDQTITTQGGRAWAAVHMAISVASLGELISTIDSLRDERRREMRRITQLTTPFDQRLLDKMLACAKELRPKIQRDGEGLTELEYVLTMCIELKIIDWDQVRPFIKRFRRLDIDGNGRLGNKDLELAVKDPTRIGKVDPHVMRQIQHLKAESEDAADLEEAIAGGGDASKVHLASPAAAV